MYVNGRDGTKSFSKDICFENFTNYVQLSDRFSFSDIQEIFIEKKIIAEVVLCNTVSRVKFEIRMSYYSDAKFWAQ